MHRELRWIGNVVYDIYMGASCRYLLYIGDNAFGGAMHLRQHFWGIFVESGIAIGGIAEILVYVSLDEVFLAKVSQLVAFVGR